MSAGHTIHVTDEDFAPVVLEAPGLKVVDFWAPWCGPCHTMSPALEAFAGKNADRVRVYKLDVDDNPKTAEQYEIRTVPTVFFFRDADPVEVHAGALSETSLQEKLDTLLGFA